MIIRLAHSPLKTIVNIDYLSLTQLFSTENIILIFRLLISEKRILFIHRFKTSALLQIAFMAGAILAGAPEKDIELLSIIGENN